MQDKKDKGSSRNLPSQSSQPSQRSQPSQPPKREVANLPDLIEIINTDQGLRFFTSNCELKDSVLMDGVICIPIRKNLFPVPDEKMMEYLGEDDSDLFDAVESFIREHVDCPHERHPEILTAFTFHTYLPEKAETSPIIWFHGPKGSGKSRGGEVLSQLCRRGLSTASLTGPGLFRVNELCTPTFVIDEIQIYGEKGDKNLKDMLNVRYKKGKQIIRINIDKKGSESVETFNAFGPTVL